MSRREPKQESIPLPVPILKKASLSSGKGDITVMVLSPAES